MNGGVTAVPRDPPMTYSAADAAHMRVPPYVCVTQLYILNSLIKLENDSQGYVRTDGNFRLSWNLGRFKGDDAM